jgi:hypothetical protein
MRKSLRFWSLGIIYLFLFLLTACSKDDTDQYSDSEIVARVGDRIITKSEFIMRAEYTPRPAYCRRDNYVHKKIILNALIAEKLLALDLQSNSEYMTPPRFEEYLTGRKEQAMRQLHRYENGIKKASPSSEMLNRGLRNARREYQVAYFTLPDSTQLPLLESKLAQNSTFESLSFELTRQSVLPQRTVSWFDDDERAIREAIYSQPLERDSILKPIKLKDGSFIMLKILEWEDTYSLSESANQTLWEDVVSKVETRLGSQLYIEYVSNMMSGKSFKFEKETFRLFVEDLANIYMLKDAQKESIINEVIWDIEKQHLSYGDLQQDVQYLDQVLFTFEGDSWTVKDLFEQIAKHPLVYRNTKFPMSEFPNEVRMAVADLLRDISITEEAYASDYGDRIEVKTHVQMWQDHYLADVYKRLIKASTTVNNSNPNEFIETHLNPVVDKLQEQYSSQIFINFDLFDSVDLTSIDMFVTQEQVAYPIMVPSFPQIYTDHKFDYGNKFETQ